MVNDFGHPRTRREGVEKGEIFADVLYGWSLVSAGCIPPEADRMARFRQLFHFGLVGPAGTMLIVSPGLWARKCNFI